MGVLPESQEADRKVIQKAHSTHRWSGWPGGYCLACGMEDPLEQAFAEGNYIEVPSSAILGFHYEFPNVTCEPCPIAHPIRR